MYRDHQIEKKSRYTLHQEDAQPEESAVAHQQHQDAAEGNETRPGDATAALGGETTQFKTTEADRAFIERDQFNNRNFYAIDTETNGFKHNEPLQIAVVLYQDGQETESFNHFYTSDHPCTKEALELHRIGKKKLREVKAKPFDRKRAKVLLDFLNKHDQLPIVAFYAGYDRNKVLNPALQRLGHGDLSDLDERWICAQERCKRTRRWDLFSLDDFLEHFGHERRKDEDHHDALVDARLAAVVYMAASELTPLKYGRLGFLNEKEEDD